MKIFGIPFGEVKSSLLSIQGLNEESKRNLSVFLDYVNDDDNKEYLSYDELTSFENFIKYITENQDKQNEISGQLEEFKQLIQEKENPDNKENNADIKTPGAKWMVTSEYKHSDGNSEKITAAWQRLNDGTSKETKIIVGEKRNFRLVSHYESDDKTPITKQTITQIGSTEVLAQQNYENNELKSIKINLDNYYKDKSLTSSEVNDIYKSLTTQGTARKQFKTAEIKNKNDVVIIGYKKGSFYSDVNGSRETISEKDVYNIILSLNKDEKQVLEYNF